MSNHPARCDQGSDRPVNARVGPVTLRRDGAERCGRCGRPNNADETWVHQWFPAGPLSGEITHRIYCPSCWTCL